MGKIVITGASSDIGLAIARRLGGLGLPLLLQCRSHADRLDGLEAEVVRADFADREELKRFVAKLQDVEILVNAAADTQTGLLPQLEDADIDRMLAVNVAATTLLCKAVIPQMCLHRRGVIVNLSSVTASRVYRGQSVYGGTKAYIETFTRGLAAEYAPGRHRRQVHDDAAALHAHLRDDGLAEQGGGGDVDAEHAVDVGIFERGQQARLRLGGGVDEDVDVFQLRGEALDVRTHGEVCADDFRIELREAAGMAATVQEHGFAELVEPAGDGESDVGTGAGDDYFSHFLMMSAVLWPPKAEFIFRI